MIYILNRKQEMVGVAVNGSPNSLPYTQDIHYETLEGIHTYEFVIPANHEGSVLLEVEGHVIIKDMDGNFLLFVIKEIMDNYENNVPVRRVVCESAATSELLGDVVRPVVLPSSSLENTANLILNSSSGWSLGELTAIRDSRDFEIEDYMTVLEAFIKVMDEYDVEIYYTVELVGTKIVSKKVNIATQRGIETGLRFDYGYHLRNISRTENSENIITALIPVGKGDSDATRLSVVDLATFDEEGYYHTVGTDWVGYEPALQQWSKDGNHIFGYKVFDHAESPNHLKGLAIAELKQRSKPSLLYSTTVIDVERITGYDARKIRLGDTVIINDSTFNPPILISGRVQELKRSYTNSFEFNDDVKLGNYKTLTRSVPIEVTRLQNYINQNEGKWDKLTVGIESTGGTVFKNGIGATSLVARTFRGTVEIDSDGSTRTYTWTKFDKDGNLVEGWSRSAQTIIVNQDDVDEKATFKVDTEGATAQVTIVEVYDGTDGAQGEKGDKGDTGSTGSIGPQGPAGSDAQSKYTWVMYGDDNVGTGITSSPAGKLWRGRAFNKTSATASTIPADYTWEFITDGWVKSGTTKVDGGQISADSLSAISANLGTVTAGVITGVTVNSSNFNLINAGNFTATDSFLGTNFLIKEGTFIGAIGNMNAFYGFMDGDLGDYKGISGGRTLGYISIVSRTGGLTSEPDYALANLELNNLDSSSGKITAKDISASGAVTVSGTFTATQEAHFSIGSYSDPRSGVGMAIKASGGIATNYIYLKDGLTLASGNFNWSMGNGQYMLLEQGTGATIFRGNGTRLVFHENDATLRVESWNGGYATLNVGGTVYTSDRELKKNIENYTKSALVEINSTPIREYHMIEEIDDIDLKHVGIILQEAPLEVVDPRGKGIDNYAMVTLAWKAIQELSAKITELEQKLQ